MPKVTQIVNRIRIRTQGGQIVKPGSSSQYSFQNKLRVSYLPNNILLDTRDASKNKSVYFQILLNSFRILPTV